MAALEYPCLKISDTSSISAGAWNEALYGIGSVILWRDSATCEGTNNVVRPYSLLTFHPALILPALFLILFKVACFSYIFRSSFTFCRTFIPTMENASAQMWFLPTNSPPICPTMAAAFRGVSFSNKTLKDADSVSLPLLW